MDSDNCEMIIWEDMGDGSYEAWEPSITLEAEDTPIVVDWDVLTQGESNV